MDSAHHEFDVSRAVLLILGRLFPLEEEWSIVPEFLEPGGKRPDFVVEKFHHNDSLSPKQQFVPKIAVELKSGKGKSLTHALDQSTDSMVSLVDELGDVFNIFIIIVKGKTIGFFEYHNDRSNLYEGSIRHHKGAIPFNHPQQPCPAGRPTYIGTGVVPYEDEWAERTEYLEDMGRAFLDIDKDSVAVQNVLNWMKHNNPLPGPM